MILPRYDVAMTLQQKLIHWFHHHARPLPWRVKYRPYEVWVSEIMLQQTQVETALPYFRRWMRTFPTLASLARADENRVLKTWEGLGYYSRARNLHASAKFILKKYGGRFPSDFDEILSLKGIGRYTAGAIASIAFNQDRPIVDGNVLRVLSRVYAIKKPIDVGKNEETFWRLEEKLIPKGQARYFNQALMELGALVCRKEDPLCASCPICGFCKAYKRGQTDAFPVRKNKKKMVKIEAAALILSWKGKYLIRKRPLGMIMGGLWEFPEWKLSLNHKLPLKEIKRQTLHNARKEFGENLQISKYLGPIKRNYTHHLESLHIFEVPEGSDPSGTLGIGGQTPLAPKGWNQAWITKKDFTKYPFSSAHAKIAKLIS